MCVYAGVGMADLEAKRTGHPRAKKDCEERMDFGPGASEKPHGVRIANLAVVSLGCRIGSLVQILIESIPHIPDVPLEQCFEILLWTLASYVA